MAALANEYIIIEQQFYVAKPEGIHTGQAMIPLKDFEYIAFDYFKLNQRLLKRFYIHTEKRRFFISEKCYNNLLKGELTKVKLGGTKNVRKSTKSASN